MNQENKPYFLLIALGTIIIAIVSTSLVFVLFGKSAAYFFMIVLSLPIGAICSLLLLILFKSKKPNRKL